MADIFIGNIKGPQGDTGPQGNQGEKGDAATIRVGSVTTTQYGQTARVTNSGTEHDAVFDFVIPQGRPGEQTTRIDNLLLDALTEPSTQFPVPAVGDNGSTLFGKISKWFSDMAALVATKFNAANVVNNLTTTASGYALDARQGKTLNESIEYLNTKVNNLIKQAAITGTTDANGNVVVQTGLAVKVILFAWDDTHLFIPFRYRNAWYCRVQMSDATGSEYANMSVNFNILFIQA